jgi:hypothetical protein
MQLTVLLAILQTPKDITIHQNVVVYQITMMLDRLNAFNVHYSVPLALRRQTTASNASII